MGVEVTNESVDSALARLAAMLDGRGRATLFFVNAHTLNQAATDPFYRDLLNRSGLVYGDGTGLRWAAACRGVRMKANLNGTDLIPALLSRSPGLRYYLLGGSAELVEAAARRLQREFPACQLVGLHHGYLDARSSDEVVEQINSGGADLLLVGMGNPLQEQWIARYRGQLRSRLCVGVGGLFAYWAGTLDRAPAWMRHWGIEWLHILRRQPWKLRRYLLGNPLFLLRMLQWVPADLHRTSRTTLPGPAIQESR
jgi:N-acetylglucosaminyldiphosphoundecaprenol N-acetyl-beta-D-mannosaminyltransferase